MATNIPAGYAQAAWIFSSSYGTAPFVFTIGVNLTDGITDPAELADGFFDAWDTAFTSDLSEALTLDKVTLSIGQGGDIVSSIDSTRDPVTGTRSGDNDPIALALLVNKKSSTPGRKGRGRMFLPGVLAGSDTGLNGDLTPSAKTKHEANLSAFSIAIAAALNDVDPESAGTVILHSDASTPSVITALNLAPKVGVLRNRLR